MTLVAKAYLEKDIYRQITIFNYLLNHRSSTLKDLALSLDVSENTLRHDLQNLKLKLDPAWDLQVTKGFGVTLNKPIDQTPAAVYTKLWSETLFYKILFVFLIEDTTTTADLIERFYSNNRTVKNALAHLEERLTSYGLTLQKNPLQIQGTEIAIRYFFYDHIRYFFAKETWRFEALIPEIPCISFLRDVANMIELKYNCSIPLHHKWDYILYITIMVYRNINKHEVQFTPAVDAFMPTIPEYMVALDVMELLQSCYPKITMHVADIYHITFPLLSNVEITTYLGPEIPTTNELLNEQFKIDALTHDFLSLLETMTGYPLHSEQIVTIMHKKMQMQTLKSLIGFSFSGFENIEINHNLALVDSVKKAYEIVKQKYHLPELYNSDILAIVYIIESEAIFNQRKRQVLIIMSEGKLVEEHIRTLLLTYLGQVYDFVISNTTLTGDLINYQADYYAIISNFSMPSKITTPILNLSSIPTKSELQTVVNFLLDDMYTFMDEGDDDYE